MPLGGTAFKRFAIDAADKVDHHDIARLRGTLFRDLDRRSIALGDVIQRLVDLGADALLLEAEDDLGGTWYHNRYPGCRFDSESYTYGYSFSKELLEEWHWTERFSPQPENLRYLNFVAEKFDLRRHMRFESRVDAMTWDEASRTWRLDLEGGDAYTARFVITLSLIHI